MAPIGLSLVLENIIKALYCFVIKDSELFITTPFLLWFQQPTRH